MKIRSGGQVQGFHTETHTRNISHTWTKHELILHQWDRKIPRESGLYHCCWCPGSLLRQFISSHYSSAMVSAMASQIIGVSMVCSTVSSGADQGKHHSSALLAFVRGIYPVAGEFPSQRALNVKNVSIWWRHHGWYYPYLGTKGPCLAWCRISSNCAI